MNRFVRLGCAVIATVSLLITSFTLTTPPSWAAGSMSSPNGVLYDDCRDHPYRYDFDNFEAASWTFDSTVYGPDGLTAGGDFDIGDGTGTTGSGDVFFCGGEEAGRYSVEAQVTYYDFDYKEIGSDYLSTSFTMVKARTATALKVSDRTPKVNSVVKFKIRSRHQVPAGLRAHDYEYVALYAKCRGASWARVKKSKTVTDGNGKATLRYRWNLKRKCKIKAYTLPDYVFSGSWSPVVKVKPN